MSVNIGNGNKIKNSTIAETVNDVENAHPVPVPGKKV